MLAQKRSNCVKGRKALPDRYLNLGGERNHAVGMGPGRHESDNPRSVGKPNLTGVRGWGGGTRQGDMKLGSTVWGDQNIRYSLGGKKKRGGATRRWRGPGETCI